MKVIVSVNIFSLIILSAALLLVPLPIVLCFLLASLVHEFFHISVGLLLGGTLSHISIYPHGAKIVMLHLSNRKAILSTIAGPVGSLFLLLFWHRLPILSLCGLIEGMFNLLPLYPLDGGRIIRLLHINREKNALH